VGRDSSVCIATRCERSGDRIPVGGEIFHTHPNGPWGPPSLLYSGYRVSFQGVKRPGRGLNHPSPSSAEVKERVELYFYSASGSSWPALERKLRFISTSSMDTMQQIAEDVFHGINLCKNSTTHEGWSRGEVCSLIQFLLTKSNFTLSKFSASWKRCIVM
jgi:hypothetical protein